MAHEPDFEREPPRVGQMARGPVPRRPPPRPGAPGERPGRAAARSHARFHFPQRVTVKVHIARHHTAQRGRDALRRHVQYLARENATVETGAPRFFDAQRDDLDACTQTRAWGADRHHLRVVVSPERGADLPDLRAYMRRVMAQVERDLGTAVEWLAVNHTNTQHPHAHVLIRGRRPDGSDLVIARDYIAHGMRTRAAEVATTLLGERTMDQARTANRQCIQAERWTTLDWLVQRAATPTPTGYRIEPRQVPLSPHGGVEHAMLVERLEFLSAIGLARELTPAGAARRRSARAWEVPAQAPQRLRELGARGDVIKALHAALGRAPAARLAPQLRQFQSQPTAPLVRGVLVAKGVSDELRDGHFLLLRDLDGNHQYTRVRPGAEYDALQVGGVVELGRRTQRDQLAIEALARIAERDEQSRYATGHHRQLIEAARTPRTAAKIERTLAHFANRVARLARRPDTGVIREDGGGYRIDAVQLRAFGARIGRWPDVRIVSARCVADQVAVEAYTWLDRQIVRSYRHGAAVVWLKDADLRAAYDQRIAWLVAQGHAERPPTVQDPALARLRPEAIRHLQEAELRDFAARCKQHRRQAVHPVRAGQQVTGRYRGLAPLHAGLSALIEAEDRLFVVPVARAPWAVLGQAVTARRRSDGRVWIECAPGRSLKPGLER